jgi:hypothetical protein|tara:strand:+ start:43 stop:282 length:240 start_codon:yes stop_codon:yes gene_type:complete
VETEHADVWVNLVVTQVNYVIEGVVHSLRHVGLTLPDLTGACVLRVEWADKVFVQQTQVYIVAIEQTVIVQLTEDQTVV